MDSLYTLSGGWDVSTVYFGTPSVETSDSLRIPENANLKPKNNYDKFEELQY